MQPEPLPPQLTQLAELLDGPAGRYRLWQVAHGEALDLDEIGRFVRFCRLFGHQTTGLEQRIERVAAAEPWRDRAGAGEELQEIDELLDVGRRLVEAIERLVCKLYGVADALTDRVVESAVARAGTVALVEH